MRLQTFISHHSVHSRRKAFDLVQEGKVKVNGDIIMEPSFNVDPARDKVTVLGQLIKAESYEYIVINKPMGYVSTRTDRFKEEIVYDLLPEKYKKLTIVGRLDKDTEGLLLLTNDGDLANRLTHPRYELNKTYFALVRGPLTRESIRKVEAGVIIDDSKTSPAFIEDVVKTPSGTELIITIHEGRKRQIRRMFDTVACKVVYLKRLSIGPLSLGNLGLGKWRPLSAQEIKGLHHDHH